MGRRQYEDDEGDDFWNERVEEYHYDGPAPGYPGDQPPAYYDGRKGTQPGGYQTGAVQAYHRPRAINDKRGHEDLEDDMSTLVDGRWGRVRY